MGHHQLQLLQLLLLLLWLLYVGQEQMALLEEISFVPLEAGPRDLKPGSHCMWFYMVSFYCYSCIKQFLLPLEPG